MAKQMSDFILYVAPCSVCVSVSFSLLLPSLFENTKKCLQKKGKEFNANRSINLRGAGGVRGVHTQSLLSKRFSYFVFWTVRVWEMEE